VLFDQSEDELLENAIKYGPLSNVRDTVGIRRQD
jgi:hypothetical protein